MDRPNFSMCKRWRWITFFSLLIPLLIATTPALAKDTSTQLRENVEKSIKGKIIGFVPIALGIPLCDQWAYAIQKEADAAGMKVIIRDPNWNASAMTQAISALMSLPVGERPDVLIVHNPNVQVLVSLLKQAQKLGIWVIQINMVSNYKTDAFVGANFHDIATEQANAIVKECGTGTKASGKVAIVQGPLTSQVCIEETQALMEVFKKDPKIKVVSNLAADWNANKAHDNIATVLQQHPDLSAIVGYWGPMTMGAAQAVKEAGLLGKVKVYTSGEVAPFICNAVKSGLFYKYWDYDALRQGHDIMVTAKMLLQLAQQGVKPGAVKLAVYSTTDILTKDNVGEFTCWSPEPMKK